MFRKNILEMEKYSPPLEGRSSGYLLLDFNERTIPPPRRIRNLLEEYSREGKVHVYPEYNDLDEIIANYAGVNRREVIFTNGSDQGIDIIFRGMVEKGDKVIIPSPSFKMFYQSAGLQGAKVVDTKYRDEEFLYPLEEVLDNIDKDTSLVVVCNPNNPTGTIVYKEDVEKIAKKGKEFGTDVMVDEAYHEFNPNITSKDLINSYDNIFITRSFSKVLGIASLRAGYVLSQENNIKQLRKIRGPYACNMEAVSVVSGLEYKDTIKEMMSYIKEVMNEAKPRTEEFFKDKGIKFCPSGANFLLIDPSPLDSEEIYGFLKSYEIRGDDDGIKYKGILVRPRSDPPNTIRVTIGTNEDMNYFMEAFTEFLESKSEHG